MMGNRRIGTVGFMLLSATICVIPALRTPAQERPAPLSFSGQLAPLSAVPSIPLAAVDREARLQEDAQATLAGPGPLRFAQPEDLLVTPEADGKWEEIQGGSLWRLRFHSPNATDLSFGFTRFYLPEGAVLYVFSEDEAYFRGPYGYGDNTPHGEFWTPVIPGGRGVVELFVPADAAGKPLLELTRIGCGYRDLFKREKSLAPEAGACNIDVICSPDADAWRDQIQSAAVFQIGSTWTCSGAMINNTARDLKPYFLTANHCGVSSSNASSIVAYWNFFSPTCGLHGGGSLSQATTGGATYRASSSPSDFCLFEFVNPPQAAWNVYWSGWDRTTGDVASAVVIHHPNCDEKSISFEDHPTATSSYYGSSSPGDGTHVWVKDYDVRPHGEGTTEPGSSGSPLYSPEHRIIGQLHGGDAACGNNSADWYGRINVSWTGGGTSSSRLSNWLDPGNTGATTLDGQWACTNPGTPSGVSAGPNGDNRIQVQWTPGTPAGAKYSIYRSVSTCAGATVFSLLASNVTANPYYDTSVDGGKTYAYKVQAQDGTGACSSAQSACAEAAATGPCISAPAFAGAASVANPGNATCALDISWAAATASCGGSVTYTIYRSTTAPFTPAPANRLLSGITGTTHRDGSALSNGSTYHYIVHAVGTANGAEDGNTVIKSGVPTGPIVTGNIVETFEAGGGFDNPGWTHAPVGGSADWAWSAAYSQTPTHSWFSASQGSISDRVLLSPEFGVLSNTAVTFWHTYAFESSSSCYDGGTLEYAVAPGFGTWTVVPDVYFTAGLFTGTVSTGFSNPIGGKRAWCNGTIGAMTQVAINLGALNGQTIKLRWHEGDDSSQAVTGWYVDSVTITNAGTAGVCASGAVNPKEASPAGNMRCWRGTGEAVDASFTTGCGTTDHAIYWTKTAAPALGALSWANAACGLGMSGNASFDPGALNAGEWVYFVVVGQNAAKEGSYGKDSSGAERPEAVGVGTCDRAQDLTGTCP